MRRRREAEGQCGACSPALQVNQPLVELADSPAVNGGKRMLSPADFDPSILPHSVSHMEQEHLKESVLVHPTARQVCLKILDGTEGVHSAWNPNGRGHSSIESVGQRERQCQAME